MIAHLPPSDYTPQAMSETRRKVTRTSSPSLAWSKKVDSWRRRHGLNLASAVTPQTSPRPERRPLGERVSAQQAADWGLVWAFVEDAELDAKVAEVAEVFMHSSPAAMVRIRESIDVASSYTFAAQLDVERDHARALIPRNRKEGAAAFLDGRAPHFCGTRIARQ